jgi:tetratricopeptide (TPR) repeat protein
MKRSERHHLKENEVALSVARATETLDQYRRQITTAAVVIGGVIVIVAGVLLWRQYVDSKARVMLADAMTVADAPIAPPPTAAPGTTPPAPTPGSYTTERARNEAALGKFVAAANQYPSTQSGIAARYRAAATLVALGRTSEAEPQYRDVINRAGDEIYGAMARLGLADAYAAAGQHDKAITAYREVLENRVFDLPVDAVLMQLGRAYALAGKAVEARQTFKRLVDEYPASAYGPLAKKELEAPVAKG